MKGLHQRWTLRLLSVGVLSLAGSMVQAQNQAGDIQSRYQQEVERCRSGQSGQALETCLKEAGAAKAEAQKHRLAPNANADYERNRLQRCQAFKDEAERRTCIERTRQAPVKGSVEGGGVLREYIEVIPATPNTPR